MCIVAQDAIDRMHGLKLLNGLLVDKTSGGNIIWATDAYGAFGDDYRRDREITSDLLMRRPFRLMSRAEKARAEQSERTRAHAEVFTPLWVVKKMNDYIEADWFGQEDPFGGERVLFPEGKTWRQYVDSRRMEITCGEAPYLVSRYDVSTGEVVPLHERVGILDRKLRVVSENAVDEQEWLKWAFRAFQATYGYEFQGDNVLLARLNLLLTYEEYMQDRLRRKPTAKEFAKLSTVIAWNIWQMDGLAGTIPYCKVKENYEQLSLFGLLNLNGQEANKQPPCRIYNWRSNYSLEYRELKEGKRA